MEQGLSVRTTDGEGARREKMTPRKGNSMQKHETVDQRLGSQVQGEQEVADGPRLGRSFAFACIDLEINTINNGKLWEPVNKGQLRSHALGLVPA